jgi:predicted metal-dependent enzyme (double-stranded beta helix superfamily)
MTVRSTPRTSDTDRRNSSLVAPSMPWASGGAPAPRQLASIAQQLAAQADVWRPLLHFDASDRWYTRLTTGAGWEAWLLTWLPGQRTDLHDHGGSSGAFTVLQGALEERTPRNDRPARLASHVLRSPQVRSFGPSHLHQVIGVGDTPAASLHVYGPALTVMNRYELDADRGPLLAVTERAGLDW